VAASSSFMAPKEVVAASSLSQRVNVFEALKVSMTSVAMWRSCREERIGPGRGGTGRGLVTGNI
jgi:hypothetical protein